MSTVEVKAGETEVIKAVFTDAAAALKTGLSPVLTILCIGGTNDGKYLQANATWGASKADLSMTEQDSTNSPGVYYYSFATVADEHTDVSYVIQIDGTATADPRYAWGEIIATPTGMHDQHVVVAAHAHLMTQDVDPTSDTHGDVVLYEDDAATVLLTHGTVRASGLLTRTPE